MQKLRHIAIATNDPKATAKFYQTAFGFELVGETKPDAKLADGYFLSDGTLNIAVLKFKTDQLGKGLDYVGLHHFGVLVEDAEKSAAMIESLGAKCIMGSAAEAAASYAEMKFCGPDGTVFDIAQHAWLGSEPLET